MGHEWIIDVLTDMKAYAWANNMGRLAEKVDETLAVVREELSQAGDDGPDNGPGALCGRSRSH